MSSGASIAESIEYGSRLRTSSIPVIQRESLRAGKTLRLARQPLRGREPQLEAIGRRLRDAEAGHGAVILVEGGAGFGKTHLLEEVGREASGFRVGSSCAFRADDAGSMAPLLTALFGGAAPLLDPVHLDDLRTAADETAQSIGRLGDALEHAARQDPLLVCIDDAHWIDSGTAAALRILLPRLSNLPIVWALAFRSSATAPALVDLLAHLHVVGRDMVTLPPLEDHAVGQLIADIVRAEPSSALLGLAALARGNPGLLVELVHGAVDEGLLHTSSGRAELLDFRVPRRVRDTTHARIVSVSPLARRTAAVAAALGESFTFDHVAAMLDVPPAALLAPVEELVEADIVVDAGARFAFHNDLIRQAAIRTVSRTVRYALQRQAIDVLVQAGVSPVDPARELAKSAEVGDQAAVSALVAASRALRGSNREVAAELGRRALELTKRDDTLRPSLAAEVALLLHEVGRADEGMAIAESALRERHDAEQEAQVRLSIARMSDVSSETRVDAGRAALAVPSLSVDLRASHASQLILNLAESGRPDLAIASLPEADLALARSEDRSATIVLEIAKAHLSHLRGDLRGALERLNALDFGSRRETRRALWVADLRRAELLLAVDQFEAACELAAECSARAERDGHVAAAKAWQRLLGRYQLRAGTMPQAAAMLDEDAASGPAPVPVTPADGATLLDRARLAIHTGDRTRTRALATCASNAPADGAPELRRQAAWVLALHAMADGDPRGARAALLALGDDADGGVLPMTADGADLVALARIALASDDRELATLATNGADLRVRLNPGAGSIAAAAAHVRGLLEGSLSELEAAAALLAGGPRAIARASTLEDLGVELTRRGDEARAIESFDEALRLYSDAGATWDASRVRRRLRDRGIRRRLVKSDRPTAGWDGLTDSELAVVRLVVQGLSNRAAAAQLFVSPHTVSMHLRHVFTKLAINSRVELTRLAVQHGLTQ